MRRYLLCAALSLACCLPAGGAEPPIVVQEGQLFALSSRLVEVQTGEGTKLFAPSTEESSAGVLCTTTAQGTGHLWWVIGPGSVWVPVWATADLAVFTPSVAGEYLILLAVQQASGQWQQLHIRAEIGGGPDPDPDPDPNPNPAENLTGVLFYEAHDLDNDLKLAQLIVSTRIRDVARFTFEPYDIDAIDEDDEIPDALAPWLKIVKDNNWETPHLLLVNENGDLVAHAKATTIDATIKLAKENLK